jgi:DNA-directed RNA polymerase subunit RPC12/RpoP
MTDSTKPVYPEPQHFPEAIEMTDSAAYHLATAEVPDYVPEESMPHVEHSYSPERFVCVRCGSRNLTRGYVVDYSDRFEQVHFAPKRVALTWLNSLLNLRPWKRLIKLDAVACRDCGAVLLEIDTAALRRAEFRRD